MAQINPKTLSWTAPTENTDGTPILEELNYRLEVDGAAFLDFPGTLNPDGRYSVDTAALGLPTNRVLTLTLRAFYTQNPELISDPSNSREVLLGVVQPNPPQNLAAA